MKPHKHKDLIIAWANGATVQTWVDHAGKWADNFYPHWIESDEYRIKPEHKSDLTIYCDARWNRPSSSWDPGISKSMSDNLKLTFDGETGKLKLAEVIS